MAFFDTASTLISRRQKNALKHGIAFTRRFVLQERAAPSFMVIGAQKAGTTSLFKHLIDHGGYLRPLLKDIYYFDRNFDRGRDWYLSFFPTVEAMKRRRHATSEPVVTGEGATHYLLHPWAPERMHATFPKMRIVVLLRDPTDRAISHYKHNLRAGTESAATALEAFQMEERRIATPASRMLEDPGFYSPEVMTHSYLARGRYAEQLARWFKFFPRNQMLIVSSESFFANTDFEFRRICRFIGLSERSLPAYPAAGQSADRREDEAAVSFARAHFRPHNEALETLLGVDFGWAK